MARLIRQAIEAEYTARYQVPQGHIPRDRPHLLQVLTMLKHEWPHLFCPELRVSLPTFDALVAAIEDDPVFSNNSLNAQLAVEHQLAITLYRFGYNGNTASV